MAALESRLDVFCCDKRIRDRNISFFHRKILLNFLHNRLYYSQYKLWGHRNVFLCSVFSPFKELRPRSNAVTSTLCCLQQNKCIILSKQMSEIHFHFQQCFICRKSQKSHGRYLQNFLRLILSAKGDSEAR